jgi:hypothetical protein
VCLMECQKYFGRKSVRRRKGKHGSAVDSCNGKLQKYVTKCNYSLSLITCDAWCRGRAKCKEKGTVGGGWGMRPVSGCVASQ